MKKCCLYLCCILLCQQSCNAQNTENKKTTNYIKTLEKEISSNYFIEELFSDSVIFEVMDIKRISKDKIEIEKIWNIVKQTFKNTDFVINYCDTSNNKCFEIKNHKSIYLIELNTDSKIIFVKEVKIKLPPNSPSN